MPFHRRVKRKTRGKLGVKHADSFINNIGGGSAPTAFTMVDVDAGARSETHQSIQNSADTNSTCMVGQLVKYINVHIQVAPRGGTNDESGWLEYAVVWQPEDATKIAITNMGTMTLGEVATNFYRNDCLWTGFIPTGKTHASGAEFVIKCPKQHEYLKIGDSYILYCWYRSSDSTESTTDAMRLVQSCHFKAYS